MDCDDDETRDYFKQQFYACHTVNDFLQLWSTFYENKVCLPSYYSTFVNDNGDNPQATLELGKKFKAITLMGVIPMDSQVTIPFKQKGYIHALAPTNIVRFIATDLNRYNNIIAFNYNLTESCVGARNLFVTYNDDFITGEPYTHVGTMDNYVYYINAWINSTLKGKINVNTYQQLVIVNPSFDSSQEYIVDVLLNVLNNIDIIRYLKDDIKKYQTDLEQVKNELKGNITKKEKKEIKMEIKVLNENINRNLMTLKQYK